MHRRKKVLKRFGMSHQTQTAVLLLWLLVFQTAAAAAATAASAESKAHAQQSSSSPSIASDSNANKAANRGRVLLQGRCGGGAAAVPQRALRPGNSSTRAAAAAPFDDRRYTLPKDIESPLRSPWVMELMAKLKAATSVGPATIAGSSGTKSATSPSSICPNDKAFQATGPSRTTCRLVVTNPRNKSFLCTAWFISPRHVVTAGHCVTDRRSYNINLANPGFLCCSFKGDKCRRAQTWNLVQWVTTEGYFNSLSENNDGAVIEVEPAYPERFVRPLLQNMTSFSPRAVKPHFVYLDGYPAQNWLDSGCDQVDETKRYQTRGRVIPDYSQNGKQGSVVSYWGVAGCVGQSGGRVLLGGQRGLAYGIQTYGYTQCVSGYGLTGVTQITLAAESCGVCVSCLMRALTGEGLDGGNNNGTIGNNGTTGNGTIGNETIGNGTVGNGTIGNGTIPGNTTIGNSTVGNGTIGEGAAGGNSTIGNSTAGNSTAGRSAADSSRMSVDAVVLNAAAAADSDGGGGGGGG